MLRGSLELGVSLVAVCVLMSESLLLCCVLLRGSLELGVSLVAVSVLMSESLVL